MEEDKTYIYPTNFNLVKIECTEDGCAMFIHKTQEVNYIQLAMTSKLFEGTTFHGEVLEASDGGTKFLVIYDVTLLSGNDISNYPYAIRLEALKGILRDPDFFDAQDLSNEYRVRFPIILECHRVDYMTNVIIPNHYGKCSGYGLTQDTFEKKGIPFKNGEFLVKRPRTKQPDVYIVHDTLVTPVTGNKYMYIPNLETSRRMSDLFNNKTSLRMKLEFDQLHQKWKPAIFQA